MFHRFKRRPTMLCLVGRFQLRGGCSAANSRRTQDISRRNEPFRRKPMAAREGNPDHEHHRNLPLMEKRKITMLIDVLQHTPHWVWGVLAVLVSLGIKQTLPRPTTLRSATPRPLPTTPP